MISFLDPAVFEVLVSFISFLCWCSFHHPYASILFYVYMAFGSCLYFLLGSDSVECSGVLSYFCVCVCVCSDRELWECDYCCLNPRYCSFVCTLPISFLVLIQCYVCNFRYQFFHLFHFDLVSPCCILWTVCHIGSPLVSQYTCSYLPK